MLIGFRKQKLTQKYLALNNLKFKLKTQLYPYMENFDKKLVDD